jgi:hypothetical protein
MKMAIEAPRTAATPIVPSVCGVVYPTNAPIPFRSHGRRTLEGRKGSGLGTTTITTTMRAISSDRLSSGLPCRRDSALDNGEVP